MFLNIMSCILKTQNMFCSSFSALKKPEIGSFSFSKDLHAGKRTVITCSVIDGDPPFKFLWLKDGQPLSDTENFSIKNFDDFTSALSISNLSANSNGNYVCRVSNEAGSEEKHDTLLIKGKYLEIFNYLKNISLFIKLLVLVIF